MIVRETDMVEIPSFYTLDNKLIYVAVYEYIKPFIEGAFIDQSEVLKMKIDLSNSLLKTFKHNFTKIELTYQDKILKGIIEYENGLPLAFELKQSGKQ